MHSHSKAVMAGCAGAQRGPCPATYNHRVGDELRDRHSPANTEVMDHRDGLRCAPAHPVMTDEGRRKKAKAMVRHLHSTPPCGRSFSRSESGWEAWVETEEIEKGEG